jgi:hypothetical protein
MHPVGKDCAAFGLIHGTTQQGFKSFAVENVVPQHQSAAVIANERLPDQEGLSQSIWRRLFGIGQIDAPLAAVTQQEFKARQILRGGDDEDVANTGQHQSAERVVNHGLVVDWQQLLGDRLGHRIQPGAGSPGEDDAFHEDVLFT